MKTDFINPHSYCFQATNLSCCCNCDIELTIKFQNQQLTGVYNGPQDNDLPFGTGRVLFYNRPSSPINSYIGKLKGTNQFEFSDKNAIIEYTDGRRFEGEVENGALVNGKMTYANGDVYEGGFNQNGERHGQGKLTRASSTIEGNWESDGKVVDATKLSFQQGWFWSSKLITSTGTFKQIRDSKNFHAVGKLKTINHDYNFSKIETYNDQGELHGNVAVLSADGKHIFVGEYNNSKLKGKYNFWKGKDDYTITEDDFDGIFGGYSQVGSDFGEKDDYLFKLAENISGKSFGENNHQLFKWIDGTVCDEGNYSGKIFDYKGKSQGHRIIIDDAFENGGGVIIGEELSKLGNLQKID